MYDPSVPQRGPSTVSEWIICAVLLVGILGLFAAEICENYHPVKLSALLVVLFWIPLLAIHEAGHAAMARWLRWHVSEIVIGMGRVLGQFRLGTARVEIRLIPVEGFVRTVPTRLRRPQFESALIFAAGPGVELLLASIVLVAVGPRLLEVSEDYGLIVCQSFALAATSQALLNLLPFAVHAQNRVLYSDGLGVVMSLLRPTAHYAQMIGQRYDEVQQTWEPDDSADWRKRDR
jgi:hypothetical protein